MVRRLSNRFQWIQLLDREILFIDFSELYGQSFIREIKGLRSFIEKSGKNNIHVLVNTSGSYITAEVFKEMRQTAKKANPQIEKVAIIGSTTIQEIFIKILRNLSHIQFKSFDNEEEAKIWLIQ